MQVRQEERHVFTEYRLQACYTDAAVAAASREQCTRVRITALLATVQGQHRREEKALRHRATNGGGMLKSRRAVALLTTVQGQHRGNEGRSNIGPTALGGGGRRLKNVRVPGRPLLSTRRGKALQHRRGADVEGARAAASMIMVPSGHRRSYAPG